MTPSDYEATRKLASEGAAASAAFPDICQRAIPLSRKPRSNTAFIILCSKLFKLAMTEGLAELGVSSSILVHLRCVEAEAGAAADPSKWLARSAFPKRRDEYSASWRP